jgi:hypothetical protein
MQTMTIFVVRQTGYGQVVRVAVSLARIPCLIDGRKYLEPQDMKPPEDRTERYRAAAPRVTLRSLVRLSVWRDADQQGRQLESRRAAAAACQRVRTGAAPQAEAAERLDRPA